MTSKFNRDISNITHPILGGQLHLRRNIPPEEPFGIEMRLEISVWNLDGA